MPDEQLSQLLQQLRNNDRNVLKLIFQKHYRDVCKAIYRYVKDQSTVEDIAQDVFIKIWDKRHSLNINTSFGAYLYRMGINEAITYLRKQNRRNQKEAKLTFVETTTPSTEEAYLNAELNQQITRAIETLPPRCQLIFKLSRFEELSYREIAEKLDISIKTVENQMGKALRILRTIMKEK